MLFHTNRLGGKTDFMGMLRKRDLALVVLFALKYTKVYY